MKHCFVFLLILGSILPVAFAAEETRRAVKVPIVSERCIAPGRFSCFEYENTLSVDGVSCTEDCLHLSTLNTCQLRNRCVWDNPSGCFRKRVCTDVSTLNTCRKWEERAICR